MSATKHPFRPPRRTTGDASLATFKAAVTEWTDEIIHALNHGYLELADMDQTGQPIGGHVFGAVGEARFTEAGKNVLVTHDLGFTVGNAVVCAKGGPFVFAGGTIAPSDRGVYMRCWPLLDRFGEPIEPFPVIARVFMWGTRRPEFQTP